MKGVVLAGGYGTRLRPLTHIVNKHLLPIYDRPMISYPFELLKRSGVSDVLVVSEELHTDQFRRFLGDGSEYGISLTYAGQKGAGGIAHALSLAKDFASHEAIAVVLGDNIFEDQFAQDVASFKSGAKVFLKEVSDPERFGVPMLKDGVIVVVHEKPKEPQSRFAVTGFYIFDSKIFDIIQRLRPSRRGELEITDAVNAYARTKSLSHSVLSGYWADAGTFESLLAASNWAARKSNGHRP